MTSVLCQQPDNRPIKAVADAIWLNLCGDIRQTDTDKRVYLDTAEAAITAYLAELPSPKVEGEMHPDDLAVDRFAAAMKAKLARKRDDGRGGWEDKDGCSANYLSSFLREHVSKGDPVDVANLAMMLHQRGERISPPLATPSPVLADEGLAGLVEQAFHEGWVSSFGTDKHRPERAWEFSSARRTLQSRKSPYAMSGELTGRDPRNADHNEGLCDCGEEIWDMCDCGKFFLNWICGMGADGQCSLAGSEDCDFECPRRSLSAQEDKL